MKQLSFRQKLWVPLICSLLCICAIFIFDAIQTRNLRIEERGNDLRNICEVSLSIVKSFGDKAQAGTMSKARPAPPSRSCVMARTAMSPSPAARAP